MKFSSINEVSQANVPVILPDTCILLDIMRSPRRDDVSVRNLTVAEQLVDLIACGSLASVIAETVSVEFNNNISKVIGSTEYDLQGLHREIEKVDEWSYVPGVVQPSNIANWLQSTNKSKEIALSWIANSLIEEATESEKISTETHAVKYFSGQTWQGVI